MSKQIVGVFLAFVFLFLAQPLSAGDKGQIRPSSKDKCPVCGMFVAKYPDWTTQIVFDDGTYVVFDGAKDMFKYLLDIKRYSPTKKVSAIRDIWVKDYYGLAAIDGRRAVYVIGSNIYGPMGKELIPFANTDDGREFLGDHKGRQILRFDEVTADTLKSLE